MGKIRVKAAAGRKLRDPRTNRPIPEDGIIIEDGNTFWHRRILAGDATSEPFVEEAMPDMAPAPKARKS